MISKRYFTPELNIFHSARNSEFGTLPWHPVIMANFVTYKQNWDFFGTKIWDLHCLRVLFTSVLKMLQVSEFLKGLADQ